ncbi:MAG TPA: hypothetical protein VK154_13335 [Chitinophagales bacterium]|nr:hypothetical protein [Chitinophagales bacterium]
MKSIFKSILVTVLAVFAVTAINAQTTTKKTTSTTQKSTSKTAAKKPVATTYGKEVQVSLKNLSEGSIAIFAGPKEDLQNTMKRKSVGGLSTNTLHVRINEVVCIVNGPKTVSCASVKADNTQLEINISGTAITVK